MSNIPPVPPTPLQEIDSFVFDRFVLDVRDRRLVKDGEAVHLPSRYFDLLVALVRQAGTLVERDALFEQVWQDVVVSDAALAQGVRTLRRALDDDASNARYIETVPGHGYRFIAAVAPHDASASASAAVPSPAAAPALSPPDAGPPAGGPGIVGATLGALGSSLLGGALYGTAFAFGSNHPAATLASLVALSLVVGVVGAASIYAGAALGSRVGRVGLLAGAAAGGLLAGALGEFAGHSLLALLTDRPVGDLTGALEGAVIGVALGLAPLLYGLRVRPAGVVAATGVATLAAFVVLALLGRPLFATSLAAALRPSDITALLPFGLPPALRVLLSALEGLMFGLGTSVGYLVTKEHTHANPPGSPY